MVISAPPFIRRHLLRQAHNYDLHNLAGPPAPLTEARGCRVALGVALGIIAGIIPHVHAINAARTDRASPTPAARSGSVEPSHFVFAGFRATGHFAGNNLLEMRVASYNPARPITSWRTAWRKLTRKAGLAGLRFHDLRHHAITELAESGASEQTIMAIAGHVSRRMLERYSHIRLEAKRNALEALSHKNKEGLWHKWRHKNR